MFSFFQDSLKNLALENVECWASLSAARKRSKAIQDGKCSMVLLSDGGTLMFNPDNPEDKVVIYERMPHEPLVDAPIQSGLKTDKFQSHLTEFDPTDKSNANISREPSYHVKEMAKRGE